jgi:hypothetical protein
MTKDHIQLNNNMSKLTPTPVLRELPVVSNAVPTLNALKPFSPLVMDAVKTEKTKTKDSLNARSRVCSTARRTSLGWSKRSNGKSADQKENVVVGKENLVGTGTTVT